MLSPGLGDRFPGGVAHVFTTIWVGEKLHGSARNFPTSRPVLDEKHVDKEATMTIVVTGATGNVGRPLVSLLAAAGARVRAVTRTPETAGFPDGVQAVTRLSTPAWGVGGVPQFPRAR